MWEQSGNASRGLAFDEGAFAARPRPMPVGAMTQATLAPVALAAGPVSPTLQQEVAYISGVTADGTITAASYWSAYEHITAYKFGASTAGTGATISYAFDPASAFSVTEQTTFREALAMWQSVADVHFVAAAPGQANILLQRGSDGSAYTTSPVSLGSGHTLGHYTGQAVISIDTRTPGFDLSGSFATVGGYGIATAIHEIGHALGLGHAGGYNGEVDPATQQFSAYDDGLYSTMSYLSWADADTAKYRDSYPEEGTFWGYSDDGYYRSAPHTVQQLDILAIQRLYGAARDTALSGGQVYGFNSNISGPLHDFFDFTRNTQPVVTLYNQGTNNILDVSEWYGEQTIDLHAGAFSSVGGMTNNLGIAFGTRIDGVRGGKGNDTIIGNDNGDTLSGGAGHDTISGGKGNDRIDGGSGSDTMAGGAGNDIYVVDGSYDRVIEAASGGYDLVMTTAGTYTLGEEIEALTFTGTGRSRETGNALDNRLTGGGGTDVLSGLDGGDELIGGAGDDTLDGGSGADRMAGGTGDDTYMVDDSGDIAIEAGAAGYDLVTTTLAEYALGAAIEALAFTRAADATGTGNRLDNRITGGGGNDVLAGLFGDDALIGGRGDDRLDGGGGDDMLTGGAGDDGYVVGNRRDVVVEDRGQGTDTVFAAVDYVLGDNLENLTLAGAARHGTGNALANVITGAGKADTLSGMNGGDTIAGGDGDDRIDGGAGNDRLSGDGGRDTLTGGGGADTFAFAGGDGGTTLKTADTIADFNHARQDVIDLSAIDAIARTRRDDAFTFIGDAAFSGHAGELRYGFRGADTLVTGDTDGDGTADLFIKLTGHVALATADFVI